MIRLSRSRRPAVCTGPGSPRWNVGIRFSAVVRAFGNQGGSNPVGIRQVQDRRSGLRGIDVSGASGSGATARRRVCGGCATSGGASSSRVGGRPRVAQQRLHDQLNALCPGLSAPAGHGRSLPLDSPTGLAVLACAVAFAGRPPRLRSLTCSGSGTLDARAPRSTGCSGGVGACRRQPMPINALDGLGATWTDIAGCRPTSLPSMTKSWRLLRRH